MATRVPLIPIVAELLDSMDRSEHYFRRMYRIAIAAARKFHYDITGSFRSVLLDVQPNGTVAWPCDYLDYSTLGVINHAGEIVPLKHNEQLSTLKQAYLASQNAVVPVPQIPNVLGYGPLDVTGIPFYWLNYYGGGEYGWIHLYGFGGGSPRIGEFTVDTANKCFYVPHGFPYQQLMLEYLSDGYDLGCKDYMIDVFAVEAIKQYIRWSQMVDLPKKYSMAEREYQRKQWIIQRRDAKVRINKARINEMQSVFREKIKLTAKA